MQCTTFEKPLSDIIQLYKEGYLIKAPQQRKKKWVEKPTKKRDKFNNQDFISFALKIRHIGLPILIVKRNK